MPCPAGKFGRLEWIKGVGGTVMMNLDINLLIQRAPDPVLIQIIGQDTPKNSYPNQSKMPAVYSLGPLTLWVADPCFACCFV